jgi:hypothetical protein
MTSLHASAAGQRGSPRDAIGFRSIKLVARGSAVGKCEAPRGEIGFRSIQLIARQSVYNRPPQAYALRTFVAVLLQPGSGCLGVWLRVQSA